MLQSDAAGDRQTDRQARRQTDKQTDRQTDRQAGRQTDRRTDGQTDRQDRRTDIQTGRKKDRQKERQTDRQDRQDRQTDRQTGQTGQTDRQTGQTGQTGRQAGRQKDRQGCLAHFAVDPPIQPRVDEARPRFVDRLLPRPAAESPCPIRDSRDAERRMQEAPLPSAILRRHPDCRTVPSAVGHHQDPDRHCESCGRILTGLWGARKQRESVASRGKGG